MATDYGKSVAKVLSTLPDPSSGLSVSDAARSMLALVLSTLPQNEASRSVDPSLCPNCDGQTASEKSPYCGIRCREIAGFVRQVRSGVHDESLLAPDRQIALGQILWNILGGGLPLRNSLIDAKTLARLMAKYEGRCAECGEPATTVDHIGSFCNRTSNLRPVCGACAITNSFGSPEVLARPETQALRTELSHRVGNPAPVRPCDDASTWNWRTYIQDRKAKNL